MKDIKTKKKKVDSIRILDKNLIIKEKLKDNLVNIKEKSENDYSNNIEYGNEKITKLTEQTTDVILIKNNDIGKKSIKKAKINFENLKGNINTFREKQNFKTNKTQQNIGLLKAKNNTAKRSQQKNIILEKVSKGIKDSLKATLKAIKEILAGAKLLIYLLIGGGSIALVVIIVICLIGLLCSSIFGIFFSGEKSSPNAMTMQDAIVECNQEFYDKLESIQNSNPHDDFVLEGNVANWRDILTIYTIKQSNGINEQEVVTMNDNKKKVLKDIYWDMNVITSEVKDEIVTVQGVNTEELPKQVQKKVLHIKIDSKNAADMKNEYHFNPNQIKQYNELYSDKYASLWNSVVYGMNFGKYINWRQKNAPWSSIRIGNTTSTISDIGCLVTSIAILIQKSGVDTNNISPFNPGTFVEELNKNGGFDEKGNLQYAPINKIIPQFKYVGNINLRGKTRAEKLALISQYFNNGYYLTVEVRGATEGSQHWVAVIGINGNNIIMVDPATNYTDMWSTYEFSMTSQFNYFKAN